MGGGELGCDYLGLIRSDQHIGCDEKCPIFSRGYHIVSLVPHPVIQRLLLSLHVGAGGPLHLRDEAALHQGGLLVSSLM